MSIPGICMVCAIVATVVLSGTAMAQTPPKGHVFWSADFDDPAHLPAGLDRSWLTDGPNGKCLKVTVAPGQNPLAANLAIDLPVAAMRGSTVAVRARVKAQNVSQRPQSWNGIKVMMPVVTPAGTQWPQAGIGVGSFDWQPVSYRVDVPPDASEARLVLGLELVSGTVWFDDVTVEMIRGPRPAPAPRPGPRYTGHTQQRLRGAMIGTTATEDDLMEFGQKWGANLIRWQLTRPSSAVKTGSLPEYNQWLAGMLKRLDEVLPICQRAGLMVVIDLHSPPGGKPFEGGYTPAKDAFFTDPANQARFIEIWKEIATRYKGSPAVWGYDLVNEPDDREVSADCMDWFDLATATARAIRQIDPQRTIIIEPNGWGSVEAFSTFTPIDVENVVYSGHMYIPATFSHQGVFKPSPPINYPGLIDGRQWDKQTLAATLKPARDFEQRYNVHMYIGEFSAIRWAPNGSAGRYLRDLIELYEEYGWDWSYHAFREWDGWSVEHSGVREQTQPTREPTDRKRLLLEWFAKNAAK